MGRSAIAMVAVGVLTTLAAHAPAADVWVSKEDMPIETNFSVWLYTKAVARGTTAYVLANEAAAYDLAKERWGSLKRPHSDTRPRMLLPISTSTRSVATPSPIPGRTRRRARLRNTIP